MNDPAWLALVFLRGNHFMTFAELNLNENIFKAIDACGYTIPTPIQAHSIPHILTGGDVVASAQTGTGKTAAFVLPALHRLTLSKKSSKPRVLILTPTRELASQITEAASKYGKFLRFNIVSLVGGMPYRQQLRELSGQVDIIVATPGRLLDHMDNKKLDLSGIEMLILDEADRMLDMGFIDDVKDIAKATPATRQTLLFSATVDSKLSGIVRQLLNEPKRIDLSEAIMAPALIEQKLYLADNMQHKNRLLQHFLDNENIFKAIIFTATKINADQLAQQLRNQGYEALPLHGDLKQNVRNKTVEQLRRGKVQFLVATDVAARGIDINDVTHVINYDLPKFAEDYVHRIGRTGRAGKEGIAISFIQPLDTRHLQKIERFIGEKLEFSVIEGLEPTKRMGKSDTNPSSKKKSYGKSRTSGGYKGKGSEDRDSRSSYAPRSEPRGSYARSSDSASRPEFRGAARRDDAPRGEKRESFARRDDSSRSETRGNFARRDDAPRGEARGGFARREGTSRSEARTGGFAARRDDAPRTEKRESFVRRDDSSRSEARGNFARREDAPRGGSARREGAPRGEARTGGFGARRDDTARSESRGGFARREGAAPRGEARTGGFGARREGAAPRSEARTGGFGARRDSGAPRTGGFGAPRRDDSTRGESRGGFARREGGAPRGESRSSGGFAARRDDAPRGEARGYSQGFGETKASDPRVSYAKSKGRRDQSSDPSNGFARTAAVKSKFARTDAKPKREPKEF
jgi:superfamily II DNA/RNA helicase